MRNLILLGIIILLWSCETKSSNSANEVKYTCSMHPQVVALEPGLCPVCAMDLVPLHHHEAGSEGITLNDEQIKLGHITTQLIKKGKIGSETMLTGRVVVNENLTQVVTARSAGQVRQLGITTTGTHVRQGQLLYSIYSQELQSLMSEYRTLIKNPSTQAPALMAAAKTKLQLLGMTDQQISKLHTTEAVPPTLDYFAPVSGVVTELTTREGSQVEEGTVLMRIDRTDRLWVEAEVFPGDAMGIAIGKQVEVLIGDDRQSTAIEWISPTRTNGQQIYSIRMPVQNSSGVYVPGMQANVMVMSQTHEAIVVPSDAVIRGSNVDHVWVMTKSGSFVPRKVVRGIDLAGRTEILEGLEEKENVVITGAWLLYGELVLKKGETITFGHTHK